MPLVKMALSRISVAVHPIQVKLDDTETKHPMPASILRRLSGLFGSLQKRRRVRTQRPIEIHYAETLEDRRMLSATELVADINQQAPPIGYETGIVVDGVLYFIGRSFVHSNSSGFGFWKFDPEAHNGSGELTPYENATLFYFLTSNMVELEGRIYYMDGRGVFFEFDPHANNEEGHLETLDTSLTDFNWDLRQLVVVGEDLVYRSIDGEGNLNIWRYSLDEGISNVAVIPMGTARTALIAEELVVVDGKLFFHVPGSDGEIQLWRYDPSLSGLEAVEQVIGNVFSPDYKPTLVEHDGFIYFVAVDPDRGVLFWSYDTANDAIKVVSDVNLPTLNHEIAATNSRIYLSFPARSGIPAAVWQYDPSVDDGPKAVSDLPEGSTQPWGLAGIGEEIYFYLGGRPGKQSLWKYTPDSDFEGGQTSFVTDIGRGAYSYGDIDVRFPVSGLGGLVYFQVSGIGFGDTLWIHDASANNGDGKTDAIREDGIGTDTSQPAEFTVLNGKLYFRANDTINGYELWEYNPEASHGFSALRLAADINPGNGWSYPKNLTVANGMLYFQASDGTDTAIWRFDPTTSDLLRISYLANATFVSDILVVGDRLYVAVSISSQGYKVMYYDLASPDGTTVFQHIAEPEGGYYFSQSNLVALDNQLYFIAYHSPGGHGIFHYDEEANSGAGATVRLEGLDELNVYPEAIFSSQSKIYFRGRTNEHGSEFWEYDPDGDGRVRMIADLNPGSASSDVKRFTEIDHKIYFLADYGEDDFRLWSYDPAASNGLGELTAVVESENYNFDSAGYLSSFGQLPYQGNEIYLDIRAADRRDEIWEYDIQSGLFRQIPGGGADLWGSDISELTPLGEQLYFVGLNIEIGNELFAVDIPPVFTLVDIVFSPDASVLPGTIQQNALLETLSEWDAANGQIWIEVAMTTPGAPFDLTVSVDLANTWFGELIVASHLGTGVLESDSGGNGQRTYSLKIYDLDLSTYEPGDRVLVANVVFPLNPDETVGVPMTGEGSYPTPTSEHGVSLVSAVNASTGDPFDVLPDVSGQFMPMVYDTNDDGKVGLADFAEFISNYGKVADSNSPQAYRLDFNRDGKVGIADFALFISNYGKRKFPPEAQIAQALSVESEPTGRFRATTSSDHLEGESDMSIYWVTTDKLPRASMVDDSFQNEEQDFVESKASQLTCVDTSWDARVIDAAIHEEEFFMTTPKESERDLDEAFSAGF